MSGLFQSTVNIIHKSFNYVNYFPVAIFDAHLPFLYYASRCS